MKTEITKADVLAAVNEATVMKPFHGDSAKPWPLTKGSIVDHIAAGLRTKEENAAASRSQYISRTAIARKVLTPGQVYRALDELVRDGSIVEISGTHWAVRFGYGTQGRSTYYLSLEAREIAIALETEAIRVRREAAALQEANAEVLRRFVTVRDTLMALDLEDHPPQPAAW